MPLPSSVACPVSFRAPLPFPKTAAKMAALRNDLLHPIARLSASSGDPGSDLLRHHHCPLWPPSHFVAPPSSRLFFWECGGLPPLSHSSLGTSHSPLLLSLAAGWASALYCEPRRVGRHMLLGLLLVGRIRDRHDQDSRQRANHSPLVHASRALRC